MNQQSLRGTALVAVALFLLSATTAGGVDREVLEVFHARGASDLRSQADLLSELESFGDKAIPGLLELALWGVEGPTPEWAEGDEQPEVGEVVASEWWGGDPGRIPAAAAAGLRQCSERRVVRGLLEWLEEDRAPGEVLSVVRLIGEIGATSAVDLVLDLASLFGRAQLRSHPVRRVFTTALGRLLDEDALSLQTIQDDVGDYNIDVLELLADALERADEPDSLFLVVQLFGFDRRLDVRLIAVAGSIASRYPWRVQFDIKPFLRRQLDSHDGALREAAVHSLAKLGDPESFPRFTELLDDNDPKIQRAASWALKELTGNHLQRHREAWNSWYDAELERFAVNLEACDRKLDDSRAAVALDAMRLLGQHKLFRHEVVTIIAEALRHPEPEIIVTACQTLARLESCEAVPHLVDVLFDRDEGVRQAACQALRALTGKTLPADPESWERFVSP